MDQKVTLLTKSAYLPFSLIISLLSTSLSCPMLLQAIRYPTTSHDYEMPEYSCSMHCAPTSFPATVINGASSRARMIVCCSWLIMRGDRCQCSMTCFGIAVVPITADACLPPQQEHLPPVRMEEVGEDGEETESRRRRPAGLQVIVETEGYLSSSENWRTDCVLVFQMLPGQRLNLTLMDFSARNNTPIASSDRSMLASSSPHCYPQVLNRARPL